MDTRLPLLTRPHRDGDADAFGALVRQHAGMVFATARRITQDAALAEDVAQETFLELARSGHGTVEAVAAWLHRVAWRKACNLVRGESRRRHHEQAAAECQEATAEASWEVLEPLLDEALEDLPARLREPLVRHYLEGRTQQELAAALGVSQATVSRRLDEGVGELRSRLRARGVLCGAGLGLLLGTHTMQAAPVSLSASLGKLALGGAGTGGSAAVTVTPAAALAPTLIAMTTTTKILLATAAVAGAMISVPLMTQPGQSPAPRSASVPVPAPAKTKAAEAEPPAERPHYRPAPVSPRVRDTVDAILRRHKGMTAKQVEQSAELNDLGERFIAMISTPQMEARIAERVAVLEPMKADAKGRRMLRMDFNMLDNAQGRAWLEAVVAEDAERVQDYVINTLDDAIFEFGFDPALERTSNGVSMERVKGAKPAPEAKEDVAD